MKLIRKITDSLPLANRWNKNSEETDDQNGTMDVIMGISKKAMDRIDQVYSTVSSSIKTVGELDNIIGRKTQSTIDILRKTRIIDPLDFSNAPMLVDNQKEDLRLKRDIYVDLTGNLSMKVRLITTLTKIVESSDYEGVPIDNLIQFLTCTELISIITQGLINIDKPQISNASKAANFSTKKEKFFYNYFEKKERKKRKPLTKDIIDQLDEYFDIFKYKYDPHDRNRTIVKFISKIKTVEQFKDYDLTSWFEDPSVAWQINILLKDGISDLVEDLYVSESEKNINGSKEDKQEQKKYLEHFIDLYFNRIFIPLDQKEKLIEGVDCKINFDEIKMLFKKILSKIEAIDGTLPYNHIRDYILETILKKINRLSGRGEVKFEAEIFTYESHLIFNVKSQNFKSNLKEFIEYFTEIIDLHFDPEYFLKDPIHTPQKIEYLYNEFYPFTSSSEEDKKDFKFNNRKFDISAYHHHLLAKYGHPNGEEDQIPQIEEMLKYIFSEVEGYLTEFRNHLNLPQVRRCKNVSECNDYPTLFSIAVNGKTRLERFEARRKIEMAILINSIISHPLYIYKSQNAREIEKRFMWDFSEATKPLKVSENIYELSFIDREDGTLKIIEIRKKDSPMDSSKFIGIEESDIVRVDLLSVVDKEGKEGEVFIIANKDKEDPNILHPVGEKSLYSLITKIIKRSLRIENIHDILRMSTLAEKESTLRSAKQNHERNIVKQGGVIQQKNRNYEFLEVPTKYIREDYSKSKYNADTTINSINTNDNFNKKQNIKYESRYMLFPDYLNELSRFHDVGHAKLEIDRLFPVSEKICPIELYPDLYVTDIENPKDICGKRKEVLVSLK